MGKNSVRPWTTPRTMTCRIGIDVSVRDAAERCQVASTNRRSRMFGADVAHALVRAASALMPTPRLPPHRATCEKWKLAGIMEPMALTWLVVGIGDISTKRILPAILAEPHSRLAGIVTRHPAKAVPYKDRKSTRLNSSHLV